MRRSLHAVVLSLAVFAAAVLLPTATQGQPQGKDKAKKAGKSVVKATVMVSGLSHPWSLAWLPSGSPGGGDMLVTERVGKLHLVHDGVLDPTPISGVPAVHAVRLSGLMEILPHPN